jgi:hypothetical protein
MFIPYLELKPVTGDIGQLIFSRIIQQLSELIDGVFPIAGPATQTNLLS